MNKRLLHLFNEAGFHQPEMERLGIEHKFEKFAELIVKECVDVGSQWADGLIDSDHYSFVNKKIKEYFGVK